MAHDPYVTSKIAEDLGVELVDLAALYAASDYITLHVAATPETTGMLSREAFAAMKKGVRIVNCARGELVDEAALPKAVASGKVAGAALDVFATEPVPARLSAVRFRSRAGHAAHRRLDRGGPGDRGHAHRRAGGRIPEERRGDQRREHARAFAGAIPRAEPLHRAGRAAGRLRGVHRFRQSAHPCGWPTPARSSTADTDLLRNAGLAGALSRSTANKANLVNAMQIAEHRGWEITEHHEKHSGPTDSMRLELDTETGVTTVEGVVLLGKPRLMQVDGIFCEAALAGCLLFMKNRDVPGVIGHVGTVLGRNQHQHRQLLAGPPRRARRARRAAGGGGRRLHRRAGARSRAGAIARQPGGQVRQLGGIPGVGTPRA